MKQKMRGLTKVSDCDIRGTAQGTSISDKLYPPCAYTKGVTMDAEDDGYTLTYRCKGVENTLRFPGMISMGFLCDRLYEFLRGCGWSDDALKHIQKGCDLYYDEGDENDSIGSGE